MVLVIKHVISEGPGAIGDFIKSRGYRLGIVELGKGQTLPESLAGVKAVLSMGGPMGAYEESEYPFLKEEDILIKKALENSIPFLGICLGAQLLAKATGSAVKKGGCSEIGFFNVEITEKGQDDILFNNVSKSLEVFQWHNDSFTIPNDGVLLAQGEKCENQAFKMGKCAYGLQFHVEYTPKMVEKWLLDDSNSSNIEGAETAKEITGKAMDVHKKMHRDYISVFANFCSILDAP